MPSNLLKKVPTTTFQVDDEATEFEQRVKVYQDLLRETEARANYLQKECERLRDKKVTAAAITAIQ